MAISSVGLKTSIWNNNIKSFVLLAAYPLLIAAAVWALSALAGAAMISSAASGSQVFDASASFANRIVLEYWPTILTVVGLWFSVVLLFHGSMIRMLSHASPVTREQEPELYNLLENLCISRGLPMPRLQIMETGALNAFASGIGRKSYSINVTRGLMKTLSRDELEAVLGHELTHIMNNDVRLLIISVIFTGMFGFASQFLWSSLRYNFFYGARRRDRNGRDNGQIAILVMAAAFVLWLGYLATLFTRFALSRRREYMADAGAVELTKNPEAMMRALQKIAGHDHIPDTPADIALMCIENRAAFLGLFATHPPIEDRIAAISAMTGTPTPSVSARNPWQ